MTEDAASWPEVLGALVARTDLDAAQTAWAMGELLSGEASPAQIGRASCRERVSVVV